MPKKLYFVFNPHSGRAQIKGNLLNIIDTFVKADYEVLVYPTQTKGDATEKISKNALDYDLVVASGGDGTLNEAVCGLMSIPKAKRPPLGYIPSGTVNDFATSLHIPKNQLEACKNIIKGKEILVDIGKFSKKYFVYVAAFGAFTDVSYQTNQQFKNMFGYAAYLMEGLKRVGTIKPIKTKINVEDKFIEDEFVFGMVSNTDYVGGFEMVSKDVSLNDGLFEVLLIKMPKNPMELQTAITDLLSRNTQSKMFVSLKCSKIKIHCQTPISWTVDGEYGGDHKKVEITNKSKAIRIITN
ncbi:MAG: YegS/Rv2252/BmrU family lipid kinase [Ruminococcaceae bacterium]|nr:YegS/Rv2252/BmrU family lipid kinase [Oscillospiraceae bacterium]